MIIGVRHWLSRDLYRLFTGCVWVGQRFFTGVYTLVWSRREDLLVVRKSFTAVDFDCFKVPTYRKGSSEDFAGC